MRYLIIVLAITITSNIFAQHNSEEEYHSCFFIEKSFSLGFAGENTIQHEAFGGQFRAYYNLRENICFGPEIGFSKSLHVNSAGLNVVAHYIFDIAGVGFYPVVGFNYEREKATELIEGTGVLAGAGLHRNWKRVIVFSEYTHSSTFGGIDKISAGVFYMFEF